VPKSIFLGETWRGLVFEAFLGTVSEIWDDAWAEMLPFARSSANVRSRNHGECDLDATRGVRWQKRNLSNLPPASTFGRVELIHENLLLTQG